MASASDPPLSLDALLTVLLPQSNSTSTSAPHTPLTSPHPSAKPVQPSLTAQISALQLHPAIEAALHLLNADLSSAHFLVRHMQAPPAVEGMLLHAVLHRVEGDFDNARAWLADVGADGDGKRLLSAVYGNGGGPAGEHAVGGARTFIGDVERWRAGSNGGSEQLMALEQRGVREMEKILDWCFEKFGKESWEDASDAYARPSEKIKKIGEEMTTGDRGWRKF